MPGDSFNLNNNLNMQLTDNKRKWNRSYVLKIEVAEAPSNFDVLTNPWSNTPDNSVEKSGSILSIKYPFTCDFTIVRSNCGNANTGHFVINNLSSSTRANIYKDIWDRTNFKSIQFFAGYSDGPNSRLPCCFNGTIKQAYSQRNGADFHTTIEAFDGMVSFPVNMLSGSIPAGTSQSDAIKQLANDASPNSKLTLSQQFSGATKRISSYMGSPLDVLNDATGGTSYVDSGNIYALMNNDVIKGDVQVISEANGLMGTPKKGEVYVEIDMLFEPRIKPSQLVNLESETDPRFNGTYKITGFTHRGTISGAVCGDARTSITMVLMPNNNIVYDQATNLYTLVNS